MMKFIKHYLPIIVGLVLVSFYLLTRFWNITLLPVFADEAIYIRWAQMLTHDPNQFLFLPLYDGKPPLFIWLLVPILPLFPLDPLIAARLLSILGGLGTMTFIWLIVTWYGGKRWAQIASVLLYILLPYGLFYNRLGLIDSLLTFFLAGSFYFSLRWSRTLRWNQALMSGILWGLALITKTSALYYILIPLAIFVGRYVTQHDRVQRINLIWQTGLAGGIGLSFLAALKVSPLFPFLFRRSSDFAFTPQEFFAEPVRIVSMNVVRISEWLWHYYTPLFWLILALGLAFQLRGRLRGIGSLVAFFLLFVFPYLVTGKLMASRYVLPTIIWVIPLYCLIVERALKRFQFIAIVGLIVPSVLSLQFAVPLLTNPGATPLPESDSYAYLRAWSAGYGIPETRDFLIEKAKSQRVIIATEGFFGTLPDGLLMYFDRSPAIKNLEIYGIGQPVAGIPDSLYEKMPRYDEAYLLANEDRLTMDYSLCCQVIEKFPKPQGGSPLVLLKVLPKTQ